ncbi:MAG: hypothetical protein WCC12_16305 [Anaerolineales bacterium]
MKIRSQLITGLALALAILLAACGNVADNNPDATVAPVGTNTPDPCASENMEAEVFKVHKYMREFDDAASLEAASRPSTELGDAIAELQRIRREAEDQITPPCLVSLKTYQIAHMNSVINTLIAFKSGSEQQIVKQGVDLARQQHDQYTVELARLLGVTIEPATVVPLPIGTTAP